MLMLIEIAVCLALIYALGALVCTVIHERIAQMLGLRWKNLNAALTDMLDPGDYEKLMNHPLIKDLWDATHKPTTIPSEIVARAIVHAFEAVDQKPSNDAKALLETIPVALQRQIVPFLKKDVACVEDLYAAAQTWFDSSMKAASDWYASQAHRISIYVAVAFAVAFNIDTIAIGTQLAQEPVQRAAIVQIAEKTAKEYQANPSAVCPSKDADPGASLETCLDALTNVGGDLVGWNHHVVRRICSSAALSVLAGWLASGLAMSLGARFWFNILSKLISMRAGLSPEDPSNMPGKAR